MQRLLKFLANLFLWASPLVILFCVLTEFGNIAQYFTSGSILWAIASIVTISWFLSAIVLIPLVLLNRKFREETLIRLALIKERDEREEQIVGHAARASFLFMMGILVILGVTSSFRYGRDVIDHSANHSLTIDHWSLLEKRPPEIHNKTEYFDIPLSKSGLITCLFLLQLGSFWAFAKRASNLEG